jgi:hypothetical protein
MIPTVELREQIESEQDDLSTLENISVEQLSVRIRFM